MQKRRITTGPPPLKHQLRALFAALVVAIIAPLTACTMQHADEGVQAAPKKTPDYLLAPVELGNYDPEDPGFQLLHICDEVPPEVMQRAGIGVAYPEFDEQARARNIHERGSSSNCWFYSEAAPDVPASGRDRVLLKAFKSPRVLPSIGHAVPEELMDYNASEKYPGIEAEHARLSPGLCDVYVQTTRGILDIGFISALGSQNNGCDTAVTQMENLLTELGV